MACGASSKPCVFSPPLAGRGQGGGKFRRSARGSPHPRPLPARGRGGEASPVATSPFAFLPPAGCGFDLSGVDRVPVSRSKFFGVDARARCAAASPPERRSQELSGGGCNPVPDPMPLSPRLIAGLSNSASAGPIGWTSGRWALDFGVLTGFLGVSGFFAMPGIWGESGGEKRAKARASFRWNRNEALVFVLTRFLHANRCPLRSKTL